MPWLSFFKVILLIPYSTNVESLKHPPPQVISPVFVDWNSNDGVESLVNFGIVLIQLRIGGLFNIPEIALVALSVAISILLRIFCSTTDTSVFFIAEKTPSVKTFSTWSKTASSLKDCASLPVGMISVSLIALCKAILTEVKRVVLSVDTPFNLKLLARYSIAFNLCWSPWLICLVISSKVSTVLANLNNLPGTPSGDAISAFQPPISSSLFFNSGWVVTKVVRGVTFQAKLDESGVGASMGDAGTSSPLEFL